MMSAYDRWITSEPPDCFTPWIEAVDDELWKIDKEWFKEDKILDNNGESIFNYLFSKGYNPEQAAKLIYKTYATNRKSKRNI